MKMKNAMQRSICVIGHKNPDTDSICSAIAYANLKNLTSDRTYEPRRAGEINQETAFVLEKFHMEPPEMCLDVHATVSDIDIRYIDGVDGNMTLRRAWETMRDQDITTLPITTNDNKYGQFGSACRIQCVHADCQYRRDAARHIDYRRS